jgi:hypothetical protein
LNSISGGAVAGANHGDLETPAGVEMQVDARAEIAPATEDAADSAPFCNLTTIGRTDFPKPFPSVWENRLKLKENQNDRKAAGAP